LLFVTMKKISPSIALGAASLILLGLAGCASKSDPTALVVRVESDLVVGTDIDTVVVDGHAIALASAADLPVVVAFTPSGASNATIAVTAVGRWKGADVVQQSVTAAFQPGVAVQIVMHLDRACIPKTCNPDQTCEAGSCGPKARTPTPYPGTSDAGNPRGDASPPADAADARGNDAHDAAMDGNPPAVDGSPDGKDAAPIDSGDAALTDAPEAGASDGPDSRAPDSLPVRCGDGVVNGSEICDDFNDSICGTCSATCTEIQPVATAVGTINAIGAPSLINGDTFTLSDGVHGPVVFEFNDSAPIQPSHIQIILGSSASTQMATKIALAINGVGAALQINAVVNASNKSQVLLTDINPGTAGNVVSTETVANIAFLVTGMSGGLARDCPASNGCGSDDDCQSGVCCLGDVNSPTCVCPSGVACATNTCVLVP
jgi:hypothetical protein